MPSVALVAVRVQSMQQRRYNSNNRILNTKCSCECQCQCQWQTDRLSRWQTNGGVTTPALRPPASRRRLTPVCAWTMGGFLAAVPSSSWQNSAALQTQTTERLRGAMYVGSIPGPRRPRRSHVAPYRQSEQPIDENPGRIQQRTPTRSYWTSQILG